ncbi:transcriptional regulator [Salmonella enterica]|uniref:Transcriptional regulator n=1 Tax=Salmonella enterica TaxID=28901 RepID=A0A5V3WE54_SALER|nr:transcriptional regulator [Salmonella enterica]EDD5833164.1 transcriptional regulator [Salmonella enterica subsp. enterica serovar Enteritidis]EBN4400195.1 transcriptional regulator [Salmonella enterica]EBU0743644.1 transcriptional regulator [Salmonella enterica]ECH3817556.1 transcriptional regulator [Salmonella enterica]
MRNPTASQKKQVKGSSGNCHRADIVAALHKRGLTLASLSRSNGLAPRTLNNALERHYPRAERIIAEALDTTPETLWPERYALKTGQKSK